MRETLKASYSETGRPSIDPELLLLILLIGYLYGVTSERKLVEELRISGVALVTISVLVSNLEVSEPYAADIRAGRRQPHPRPWSGLASLVGLVQK